MGRDRTINRPGIFSRWLTSFCLERRRHVLVSHVVLPIPSEARNPFTIVSMAPEPSERTGATSWRLPVAGIGSGFPDRCLSEARWRAGFSVCFVSSAREWPEKWTPAHASKRRAPSSYRHCYRRKEPLHSDQRAARMASPFGALILRAGRDNFRDNRGDNRRFVSGDVIYT